MTVRILFLALCVALLLSACSAYAAPAGCMVEFNNHRGYLVKPQGNGPFPALVVIHEWWGVNDWIICQADALACEGYVALVVDLFGCTTTDPRIAGAMVQHLNQNKATKTMKTAVSYLRRQNYVIPNRVGSIGWCFGGRQALILALSDKRLAVAVDYYGENPPYAPRELDGINAAVLGIFGDADQQVPVLRVRAFKNGLDAADIRHEICIYPGAYHAFANSCGPTYDPIAAEDAWQKTLVFLNTFLRSPYAPD